MENINHDLLAYMVLYITKSTLHPKNTKIQKIIYIYEKEEGEGLFREDFSSYLYGPYSGNVWKIIDILQGNKYIENHDTHYSLTDEGEKLLKKLKSKTFSEFDNKYFEFICNIFHDANSKMIIKYVYNKYKDDLERSIIIDDLIYEEGDYDWIRITEKNLKAIRKKLKKS